jgi:hypothetical protein
MVQETVTWRTPQSIGLISNLDGSGDQEDPGAAGSFRPQKTGVFQKFAHRARMATVRRPIIETIVR